MSSKSLATKTDMALDDVEWRLWSSVDGAKSQEAAFVALIDGYVEVVLRNGTSGRLPLAKLSPTDRAYVERRLQQDGDLFEAYMPPRPLLWDELRSEGWGSRVGKWLLRFSVAWWPMWFLGAAIGSVLPKPVVNGLVWFGLLWMICGLLLPFVAAIALIKGWESLKRDRRYLATTLAFSASTFLFVVWFVWYAFSNLPQGGFDLGGLPAV